jgi:cytoskeleton protein RodZ
MQAIGERLREARMRQGLDLTEVEVATKIRAKYLRAMENDEFAMLPGSTYVKSFLRTYAEYLGLDAQLLVEEFRAQHEPRGEGELHLTPPARPPRLRDRRGGAGMAIGPGTLAVAAVLLVLVVLALIGLVSGGDDTGKDNGKGKQAAARKHKRSKKRKKAAPAPARPPSTVRVKIVPAEPTYLCIDDGHGTKLFEGTITNSQSFRDKRVRVNIGRASARIFVNGKRFRFTEGPSSVGFSFARTGRATPLPLGERPCA